MLSSGHLLPLSCDRPQGWQVGSCGALPSKQKQNPEQPGVGTQRILSSSSCLKGCDDGEGLRSLAQQVCDSKQKVSLHTCLGSSCIGALCSCRLKCVWRLEAVTVADHVRAGPVALFPLPASMCPRSPSLLRVYPAGPTRKPGQPTTSLTGMNPRWQPGPSQDHCAPHPSCSFLLEGTAGWDQEQQSPPPPGPCP